MGFFIRLKIIMKFQRELRVSDSTRSRVLAGKKMKRKIWLIFFRFAWWKSVLYCFGRRASNWLKILFYRCDRIIKLPGNLNGKKSLDVTCLRRNLFLEHIQFARAPLHCRWRQKITSFVMNEQWFIRYFARSHPFDLYFSRLIEQTTK